jgi:hypothetical protein
MKKILFAITLAVASTTINAQLVVDSNASTGPIDEYGNCDTLTVTPAITWYINSNVNHNATDGYTYPNIVILQGGTLTITDASMTLKRNSTIRVQSEGKLVINGGQIYEANIIVENGGNRGKSINI